MTFHFVSPVAEPLADENDVTFRAPEKESVWDWEPFTLRVRVRKAVSTDGEEGNLVSYLIPFDKELVPRETKELWWGRDSSEVFSCCFEWVEMVRYAAKFKNVPVLCGLVAGESVGSPGWVEAQFFVCGDEIQVEDFIDVAESMKDFLTRSTSGW